MKTKTALTATFSLLLLAALGLPSLAAAQLRTDPPLPPPPRLEWRPNQEIPQDPGSNMSTSGFFLGVIGMLGGAAIGSGVGNAHCGRPCVPRSAAGGAAIAGSILVPVGVHLGAEKPRNLLLSVAVSMAAGSVIWAGINAIPGRPVALAPFISAPLQVWTAMRIETLGQ